MWRDGDGGFCVEVMGWRVWRDRMDQIAWIEWCGWMARRGCVNAKNVGFELEIYGNCIGKTMGMQGKGGGNECRIEQLNGFESSLWLKNGS